MTPFNELPLCEEIAKNTKPLNYVTFPWLRSYLPCWFLWPMSSISVLRMHQWLVSMDCHAILASHENLPHLTYIKKTLAILSVFCDRFLLRPPKTASRLWRNVQNLHSTHSLSLIAVTHDVFLVIDRWASLHAIRTRLAENTSTRRPTRTDTLTRIVPLQRELHIARDVKVIRRLIRCVKRIAPTRSHTHLRLGPPFYGHSFASWSFQHDFIINNMSVITVSFIHILSILALN